jgi:hypothetical protein
VNVPADAEFLRRQKVQTKVPVVRPSKFVCMEIIPGEQAIFGFHTLGESAGEKPEKRQKPAIC